MAKPVIKLLVDRSDKNMDLFYATHFYANDPFIYLELDNEKIMIINEMEYGRALRSATVDRVISSGPFLAKVKPSARCYAADLIELVLKEYGQKQLTVSEHTAILVADCLRAKGFELDVIYGPFFPEREFKTKQEIEWLTATQQANDEVMNSVFKFLEQCDIHDDLVVNNGEPVTAEMLRRFVAVKLLDYDCEAPHTIIACGIQGSDPHELGHGPIRPNQTIIMDMFPHSTNTFYWADMSRTVVKGKASDEVKRIYDAVLTAQEKALAMLGPGVNGADVHRVVLDTFSRLGFKTEYVQGRIQGYFHGTGHGVGLDIHEKPSLGDRGSILKPGHVITIEPGLYYHETGAVRLEDIGLVTETGFRNFARTPKFLEIP